MHSALQNRKLIRVEGGRANGGFHEVVHYLRLLRADSPWKTEYRISTPQHREKEELTVKRSVSKAGLQMLIVILVSLMLVGVLDPCSPSFAKSMEESLTSSGPESARATTLRWFNQAKFGLFITWDPACLASVETSWGMLLPPTEPGTISEAEYRVLYKRFNPTKFDPKAWIRLAKAAGQRYVVFVAKHHNGFCMWDSAFTDYKITNSPYGKDILAELAAACKVEGMPLCIYYSQPDMNHPGFRDTSKLSFENYGGEPTRWQWVTYLDYMELQLTELLTRYGDVRTMWFDGLGNQQKYDGPRFFRLIHSLQPGTLINDRMGLEGDFSTPEQYMPDWIPTKSSNIQMGGMAHFTEHLAHPKGIPPPEDFRPWETCMTINNTWGYNQNDRDFKSPQKLIQTLVDAASKGGNFLLDVGPTPDGTIQTEFEERLLEIGKWMKANGDSIYGTTYGPLQDLHFGKTTAKGKTIYVHVFDWPTNRKLELSGLSVRVSGVKLLAGGENLQFHQTDDRLIIGVPPKAPDPYVSVLAIKTR